MRISDWSSDVCSSDLAKGLIEVASGSVDSLCGVLHELEGEDGRYVTALDDPNQRLVLANDVRRRNRRDRKSVVSGKSGVARVGIGGGRLIKKKNTSDQKSDDTQLIIHQCTDHM